jgi:hypothetical protein
MNPAAIEHPGTGGGLRYLTEEAAPGMVNQEQSHSCQAACARQLLRDAGVDISEGDLLAKIGYYEGIGTLAQPTAAVLTQLHPKLNYVGGEINYDALPILFARDPWIANVRTLHGSVHSIIVDRLDGDVVHVRDPWGLEGLASEMGTVAALKVSDFLEHWNRAYYNAVVPLARK